MQFLARNPRRTSALSALIIGGSVLFAGQAVANGVDVPTPQEPVLVEPQPERTFPSVFGVASAFPPPNGTGYVAFNMVNPREGVAGSDADGQLSLGYTLGHPLRGMSVTVSANITGLDPFGDSGSFAISVARFLSVTDNSITMIGGSAGNLGAFGTATVDDEAYSVYVSHLRDVQTGSGILPVQVTLGYGTETTRASDGSGTVGEGVFYGIGLGVTPSLSLSLSGTETQMNFGGTMIFDALPGFSLTGGVYDISDATNRQQVSVTAAFSF